MNKVKKVRGALDKAIRDRARALELHRRGGELLKKSRDKLRSLRFDIEAGRATSGNRLWDFAIVVDSPDCKILELLRRLEADIVAHRGELLLVKSKMNLLLGLISNTAEGFGFVPLPSGFFILELPTSKCVFYGIQSYEAKMKLCSGEGIRLHDWDARNYINWLSTHNPSDYLLSRIEQSISSKLMIMVGDEAVVGCFASERSDDDLFLLYELCALLGYDAERFPSVRNVVLKKRQKVEADLRQVKKELDKLQFRKEKLVGGLKLAEQRDEDVWIEHILDVKEAKELKSRLESDYLRFLRQAREELKNAYRLSMDSRVVVIKELEDHLGSDQGREVISGDQN